MPTAAYAPVHETEIDDLAKPQERMIAMGEEPWRRMLLMGETSMCTATLDAEEKSN